MSGSCDRADRSSAGPRVRARLPWGLVGLALLVTCLAGCPGAVRLGRAKSRVARMHGCEQAEVQEIGHRRLLASGCGRHHVYYCARAWLACADMHAIVRRRASVLLQCEPARTEVRELEPAMFVARGCGRQVVQRCGLDRNGQGHCRVEVPPSGPWRTRRR